MALVLASPAKINLFLRVLGKRSDGYHELATLLQAVDWHDTLSFEIDETDALSCSDPTLETDQRNLILRAVSLFRKKTKRSFGIRIHLEKRIPMEAGLGGGSSNAATTLWALHKLFPSASTEEDLCRWSSEIGSDVPFFFSHGTALCRGRGEIVENLSLHQSPEMWIVKPQEGLSSQKVFEGLRKEDWDEPRPSVEECVRLFQKKPSVLFNDLQASAFRLNPALLEWKESLERGGRPVIMSGSGTSFVVFGKRRPMVPVSVFCQQTSFLTRRAGHWYSPNPFRVPATAGYGVSSFDV